ncbi:MAG: thiolase family protein [Peptococcaceae bacterium]|nr:thiolase family protein [Peptococcaceae bacterium]
MAGRVAIVEVAQISGGDSKDNYYDQAYLVTKEVLAKAGVTKDEVGAVVSSASDIFHGGISCASAYYNEAVVAFLKNSSRQDGESLFALVYGVMRILSGHYDTVLVAGLCKGSENPPNDTCTGMFGDPFYLRPIGMNETVAASYQMRLYMERYGITEEQCAKVAVKNLHNALRNPYAHRKGRYTVDDILNSGRIIDPLTTLQIAPKSEGFVAMLLASEEKAAKLTGKPVWFKGYGSSLDTFHFGDRDLLQGQLKNAAAKAYRMAGLTDPRREIDLAEISEPYAFQELMWYEDLGFCGEGEGGNLIDSGVTRTDGELPVNPSGGVLANNPYVSRGLQRAVEAFLQIRGEAGERQVAKKVKTALVHGTHGFAGQCHAVAILGSQE